MRRREFIGGIGAAVAWPHAARAQQPPKMRRIAFLHPDIDLRDLSITSSHPGYRALFEELRRLGYSEGHNLAVERYSGGGRVDRYAELAREVVSTAPDLILAPATSVVLRLKAATTSIPIIGVTGDPIKNGIVPNLTHPGGNITGASVDQGAEIWGKRLAILQETLPKLSNFSFLTPQDRWELNPIQRALREAANRTGISLRPALLQGRIDETQFRELFSGMRQDQAEALIVSDDATFFPYRRLITELAAANRIPAIYAQTFFVEAGGLIVYANDLVVLYRHVAAQIDKVLKGANPGDIPYYLATSYKLSVNLKTAKALSLELPATLVARADEVIE